MRMNKTPNVFLYSFSEEPEWEYYFPLPTTIIEVSSYPVPTSEEVPEGIGADLGTKLSMSLIYAVITMVGLVGNIAVCVVVVRNKVMHTATNYYLCSMAISDLLLLVTGIPHEMFLLWVGRPYLFGFYFCRVRGLTAETSTNATILTITSFTIERYIGICHPLRSHTMSHLKRVVKFILVIWILAFISAFPQAVQYGIDQNGDCNIVNPIPHTFEVSTFLFFVVPMTLIIVLYVKIGIELKRSQKMKRRASSSVRTSTAVAGANDRSRSVIKMLVAVVVAFFLCFAPFHAQRLVAMYGDSESSLHVHVYIFLTNISGVCFYLSTCVNPVLYHIMSRRFRQTFKATVRRCLSSHSGKNQRRKTLITGLATTDLLGYEEERSEVDYPCRYPNLLDSSSTGTAECTTHNVTANLVCNNFSTRAEDIAMTAIRHPVHPVHPVYQSYRGNPSSTSVTVFSDQSKGYQTWV